MNSKWAKPYSPQCQRSACGRYFITKDSGLPDPYAAWRKTDGLPVMLGTAETAERARKMCEEAVSDERST